MSRVEQNEIVNFRLIENPEPTYLEKYDAFIDNYNNPNIDVEQIKNEVGLNQKQYLKMKERAISNNDIPEGRRNCYSRSKHYFQTANGDYVIKKSINGKGVYFGTFEDESTTKLVVEECVKHNWDLKKVKDFIEEKRKKPKYYSKIKGYYVVQKSVKGRNVYFCRFKDEKTTIKVVERLEECNWDKEQLSAILNEVRIE